MGSKSTIYPAIALSLLLIAYLFFPPPAFRQIAADSEECTIGVAAGFATADGRPLLWKTRDNSELPGNRLLFNTDYPIHFLGVVNAGETEVWMGINQRGFAIVNSTALDLPGGETGFRNGELMRHALGTCASVEAFEQLLDSTNHTGRQTQSNFAVMDSAGAAAIFETGGTEYWKFSAHNPEQAPQGVLIRTNFSVTGGGIIGRQRYIRACQLMETYLSGDSLNHTTLLRHQMRDFWDPQAGRIPVPYPAAWKPGFPFGYIPTDLSICRAKSNSATVFQGTTPGEKARLATMWTLLGQPAATMALPFWAVEPGGQGTHETLSEAVALPSTEIRAELFDQPSSPNLIDSYKLHSAYRDGVWDRLLDEEKQLIESVGSNLEEWRLYYPGDSTLFLRESTVASAAAELLQDINENLAANAAAKTLVVANQAPLLDTTGMPLPGGTLAFLIWAGPDGQIDPPVQNPGAPDNGSPTGDDRCIGYPRYLAEAGKIAFAVRSWPYPAAGYPSLHQYIYLRLLNSPQAATSPVYGDAPLYQVQHVDDETYFPVLDLSESARPLKIRLMSLTVQRTPTGVTVQWKSPYKIEQAVFEINRSLKETAGYTAIWKSASGDLQPEPDPLDSSWVYSFSDETAQAGVEYFYQLKVTDIFSRIQLLGPVPVQQIPPRWNLSGNFPNPFNQTTTLKISIPPRTADIRQTELAIYNTLGQKLRSWPLDHLEPGIHNLQWDGRDGRNRVLPSGVYFAGLSAGRYHKTQRLLLLK